MGGGRAGVYSGRGPLSAPRGGVYPREPLTHSAPFLFAVFWTSVLAWSWMTSRLTAVLKSRHPRVYARLAPAAPAATRIPFEAEVAVLGFLLSRRYAQLGDPPLARLAGAMRQFLFAYAAFFLAAPLLFGR